MHCNQGLEGGGFKLKLNFSIVLINVLIDSQFMFIKLLFSVVNTTETAKKWQTASGLTSSIKRIEVEQNNGDNTAHAKSTYEYAYFDDKIPMGSPDELKLYEVRASFVNCCGHNFRVESSVTEPNCVFAA